MNDMSQVIVPKSDQINSDDFIAGPQTITIRDVQIRGGQEQPVSIFFDGSDKAFRPCKSMSRVLVQAWGPDAKVYVGRSLTLYRDPAVKWGGMEVGGIRISHMSHVEGKMVMQLTATKGQRKPHVVMPLIAEVRQMQTQADHAEEYAREKIDAFAAATDMPSLEVVMTKARKVLGKMETDRPELHARVTAAFAARRSELSGAGNSFADEEDGDDDYAPNLTPDFNADFGVGEQANDPDNADDDGADGAQPENDEPAYANSLRELYARLDAATQPAQVEKERIDLGAHITFLPDDVQRDIRKALADAHDRVTTAKAGEISETLSAVDQIRADVAAATTIAALKAPERTFTNLRVSLPDEAISELDAAFAAKRKELRAGPGGGVS